MGSSYPSNLDSFSTVRTTGQVVQAATDNDHSDAINKIEAELGTNPSGSAATVDARVASVESGAAYVPPARYIQYVAPDGSDANDGRSWGKAKLTVAAALADLPVSGSTTYGMIRLSPGLHTADTLVENPSTAPKKVHIMGAGEGVTEWKRLTDTTLLRFKGVVDTATFLNESLVSFMTINGNGFDAGGPGFSSNMVELLETNHVHFQHIRFYNTVGSLLYARAIENSLFYACRWSAGATTSPSNVAGIEIVNNAAVESNGVKWVQNDWEVTSAGRDINIQGDVTRNARDFKWTSCKWESQVGPSYAPSGRVNLKRVDAFEFNVGQMIRGQGTQLICSLSTGKVMGMTFHDGQGTYLVDFQDGGPYIIDDCHLQGSQAMSDAGGAHIHIGSSADVRRGITTHLVKASEAKVKDDSSAGRHTTFLADELGQPLGFQKTNVTAGGSVNMGSFIGGVSEYVVPRACRVVAMTLRATAASSSGALVATIQKNAVDQAQTMTLAQGSRSASADAGYAAGTKFAAGDLLSLKLTADAGYTPATSSYQVVVFLVPDPTVVAIT